MDEILYIVTFQMKPLARSHAVARAARLHGAICFTLLFKKVTFPFFFKFGCLELLKFKGLVIMRCTDGC